MSSILSTQNAQTDKRKQADLPSQYRPIGIGAVAGALVAASHEPTDDSRNAANSNARAGRDSLAA